MKKRMISFMLCVCMAVGLMCALPTAVSAETKYTEGYYTYTVTDGKATITDCDLAINGDVTIPSTLGGYPVTEIGYMAFSNCDGISNVVISDNVETIDDLAFSGCNVLKTISIGSGLKKIKGGGAFIGCPILTDITVDSENMYFESENGILFSKGKDTLVFYPAGRTEKSYTIPDSVTTVRAAVFYGCSYLTNVTIPDGVTYIGGWSFWGCTGLTEISLPESVTSIASHAFFRCTGLTSIRIPKGVTTIGRRAFNYCSNLTFIDVDVQNTNFCSQNGVLFNKDKTNLICYPAGKMENTYIIPDGVTTICEDAFEKCINLTSVIILDSVTTIDYDAFSDCTSLTDIYYTGTEAQWSEVTIGSNNDALTNTTIHYNYVLPAESNSSVVKTAENTYVVTTSFERVTAPCIILVAGYNESKEMITFEKRDYTRDTETFTLKGDLDAVKVMVWDNTSLVTPITVSETISGLES